MDSGKEWPYDAQAVTVVTQDGQKIQGMIRNEDSFTIQLMDLGENLHLYFKKDLREIIHEEKSLMPTYGKDALSKEQLRDIVAYLDQLRGESARGKE